LFASCTTCRDSDWIEEPLACHSLKERAIFDFAMGDGYVPNTASGGPGFAQFFTRPRISAGVIVVGDALLRSARALHGCRAIGAVVVGRSHGLADGIRLFSPEGFARLAR